MPWRACSRARVLDRATRPPLQAAYTASPEEPPRAASDATLTMRPYWRAAMPGSTACSMCSAPVRLMSMSLAHSAGTVLTKGLNTSQPALLTSTAMGPSCASTAATAASTWARSVMLQAKAVARPPVARMSAATFSAASKFMSNTATWAPSLAKRRQVAPPMPPPPPVTMTVLPSNLCIFFSKRGLRGGGALLCWGKPLGTAHMSIH